MELGAKNDLSDQKIVNWVLSKTFFSPAQIMHSSFERVFNGILSRNPVAQLRHYYYSHELILPAVCLPIAPAVTRGEPFSSPFISMAKFSPEKV